MNKSSKYIGATETADPGLHWKMIKDLYDVNVIITKHLENPDFRSWLLEHRDKIILHATITGWGGSSVEPGVVTAVESVKYLINLIESGFPPFQVVVRIDPIIPNDMGLEFFKKILYLVPNIMGVKRVRVSVMDLYEHSKTRLLNKGIDLSMYNGFYASFSAMNRVDDIIERFKDDYPGIFIESCAEKFLKSCNHIGCVSEIDCYSLGKPNLTRGKSKQRKTCLCPGNKIQLLGGYQSTPVCSSHCAYCYLKDRK